MSAPTTTCSVNAPLAVPGVVAESVTLTEKLLDPVVVGVPDRMPVGASVRPAGKVLPPARLQV